MNDPDDSLREQLEFYNKHSGSVRGFLFNLGTPEELVDDIVTEAFLATRKKWDELPTERDRVRYLYAVARNQRAQKLKGIIELRDKVKLQADPPDDPRRWARDHANDVINRLEVRRALQSLPERQREVVILRVIEDFSIAETAAILDAPQGTIKSDLHRGLDTLRKLLGTAEEAEEQ